MNKLKVKYTDEDALEYMRQWINEETWDDIAIMYNSGDVELMAHALVEAGAINSNQCYEHVKGIERYIERLAKAFRSLSDKDQHKRYEELLEELLKDVITINCKDCNHVSFVADHNETIYPELLESCWECESDNIEIKYPKGYKKNNT